MKKYCFIKKQNNEGYNEVIEYIEEVMELANEEYEVLKGEYENIDQAIKALSNSNWSGVLNYRFIKK